MITLSKGYKLPETGEFGDVWFAALEDNINLGNSHKHDGIDGEKVIAVNMTSTMVAVASASFVDQGNGYWRAAITIPSGGLVDNFTVTVKDPTTKDQVFLRTEKFSAYIVYIYTNFVQDFEVYFGL
jgi:hypothetical protein